MVSDLGAIAPDGSPVEVYRHLAAGDEAKVIHNALRGRGEIVELGCGTGRITHRLVELGYEVTAVDQSAEMLRYISGAETVLSDIEGMGLGRRFDAVVLASHLLNESDPERRMAFLETCRRHAKAQGRVLIERYDPTLDWRGLENEPSRRGDVICVLRDVKVAGRRLEAVMEYRMEDRVWKQPFTAALLDDDTLEPELRAAGLRLDRWLDDRRTWLEAGPMPNRVH